MSKLSLDQISPEMKASLLKELEQEQAEKEKKIREDRKTYKVMVNDTIPILFRVLKEVSSSLSEAKTYVYDSLQNLIKLKAEVYGRETDQTSHTFTTDHGITIIIGFRHNDGWDDTVGTGITKVHDYIESLGTDKNSKALVKTVLRLLAKDQNGNLKASRVLQLKKLADETGDPSLADAIQIIQDAYRPTKSKQFVTCKYKDNQGNTIELPLAITDADFNNKHSMTVDHKE